MNRVSPHDLFSIPCDDRDVSIQGGRIRSSSYVVDRTEITEEVYPRYF